MPDKYQALYQFWSQFGMNAYEENSVPDTATYPYITYEVQTANWNTPLMLSAKVWYRFADHAQNISVVAKKAQEIIDFIGESFISYKIDGGYMVISANGIRAQPINDPVSDSVRGMMITYGVTFNTKT